MRRYFALNNRIELNIKFKITNKKGFDIIYMETN